MASAALRAAYDRWADTYPAIAHNPLMLAEQTAVERRLALIRSRRALDVGTGSGRCIPLLAATGASTVVGADLSMRMLARNAHRARICADAQHLPLASESFDLVNASLVAGDITDLAQWIGELARVMTPNAHLIYTDFHEDWKRRGWQRTFRDTDNREHSLPRAHHTHRQHIDALQSARLTLVAAEDITVRAAGKRIRFIGRARDVSALTLIHAQKGAH